MSQNSRIRFLVLESKFCYNPGDPSFHGGQFEESTAAHQISVLDPIVDLNSTNLHDVTLQELATTQQALDDLRANDIFDVDEKTN